MDKHGEYKLVEFKATEPTEDASGLFAARVAVYGNVDRVGDRLLHGCFAKSLERLRTGQQLIPVIWSHEHKSPEDYVGQVNPIDAKETPEGLVVAGSFDLDAPRAKQVYRLLQRGLVKDWSFGYVVKKAKLTADGVREISEADLFELGPTLVGANPDTRTLALKEAPDLLEATMPADVVEDKAVDNSAWDGNRAMTACNSASDYRSICAGEHTVGDPEDRQHWALPHHYLGRGPNASGVRNALSRLPQTQNLKNREGAQSHLDSHMREINPEKAAPVETKLDPIIAQEFESFEDKINAAIEEKIGRVISRRTEERIRAAFDALQALLLENERHGTPEPEPEPVRGLEGTVEVAAAPVEEKSEEPASDRTPSTPAERLHLELADIDLFLTKRKEGRA